MVQHLSKHGPQLDIAGHMGMGAVVQGGEPARARRDGSDVSGGYIEALCF